MIDDERGPGGRGPVSSTLAGRVRCIREELYGENGGPLLAEALRIPFAAWVGYEGGDEIPGEVILRFLEVTDVNPHWLLTGAGSRFLGEAGEI